jgi:uncharacterized membrane protein
MSTERLESLYDNIIGFAMTLLVVNLVLPDQLHDDSSPLVVVLKEQIHRFWNFFVSFIVLAVFWMIHHKQFHFIKKSDHGLMWINIFMLIAVILVPFSTSLLGDYPKDFVANIFFGANIILLGFFYWLMWVYAEKKKFLEEGTPASIIEEEKALNVFTCLVAAISIPLSFAHPRAAHLIYVLIPLFIVCRRFWRKKAAG